MQQDNLFGYSNSPIDSNLIKKFYNSCAKNINFYKLSIKNLDLDIKTLNFLDRSNYYFLTVDDLIRLPLFKTRGIGPTAIKTINSELTKLLDQLENSDCTNLIYEDVSIPDIKHKTYPTDQHQTEVVNSIYSDIENLTIDNLDIDIRIINSLKKGDCTVIKDLLYRKLYKIRGIGQNAIYKINEAIENIIKNKSNYMTINNSSVLISEIFNKAINLLNERESSVIKMRFGLTDGHTLTLEEIGEIYNVTRERIRQIEVKAIQKLKHPTVKTKLEHYFDDLLKLDLNDGRNNNLFTIYDSIGCLKLIATAYSEQITFYQNDLLSTPIIIKSSEINKIDELVVQIHELLLNQIGSVEIIEVIKHFNCDPRYIVNQKNAIVYKGLIVLKNNKRALGKDRKFQVLNLLKDNPRPVHISEIMEKTSLKDREVRTLLERLKKYDNVVNVGPSLYSLEKFGYKNLATKKLIINLLQETGEPLNINALIKSIQNRRVVGKNTILMALNDRNIFNRPFRGYVSLNN